MDFNIATQETVDQIIHFDYFKRLVNESAGEELKKIKIKYEEHLADFFSDTVFYSPEGHLLPLNEIYKSTLAALQEMKTKDIHEVIEKLGKDAKKMKKFYKAQLTENA